MSEELKAKVTHDKELGKSNAAIYRKHKKEEKREFMVNDKKKVVSIKEYENGVKKSSLVSITKKGKRIV